MDVLRASNNNQTPAPAQAPPPAPAAPANGAAAAPANGETLKFSSFSLEVCCFLLQLPGKLKAFSFLPVLLWLSTKAVASPLFSDLPSLASNVKCSNVLTCLHFSHTVRDTRAGETGGWGYLPRRDVGCMVHDGRSGAVRHFPLRMSTFLEP